MDKQIEYIKWIDSFGCSSGWTLINNLKEEVSMECHSVGFVIDENDTYILLVPHYHEKNDDVGAQESGCGDMAIPKVAILERKNFSHFIPPAPVEVRTPLRVSIIEDSLQPSPAAHEHAAKVYSAAQNLSESDYDPLQEIKKNMEAVKEEKPKNEVTESKSEVKKQTEQVKSGDVEQEKKELKPEACPIPNVNEQTVLSILIRLANAGHDTTTRALNRAVKAQIPSVKKGWAVQHLTSLFNNGFVARDGQTWTPLKDLNGKPYTPPETRIENGIPVTKYPPGFAPGYVESSDINVSGSRKAAE